MEAAGTADAPALAVGRRDRRIRPSLPFDHDGPGARSHAQPRSRRDRGAVAHPVRRARSSRGHRRPFRSRYRAFLHGVPTAHALSDPLGDPGRDGSVHCHRRHPSSLPDESPGCHERAGYPRAAEVLCAERVRRVLPPGHERRVWPVCVGQQCLDRPGGRGHGDYGRLPAEDPVGERHEHWHVNGHRLQLWGSLAFLPFHPAARAS